MKKILLLLLAVMLAGFVSASGSISLSLNSLEAITEGDTVTLTGTVTTSGDSVSDVSLELGDLPSGTSTSDSASQLVGTLSSGQSSSKSWTIRGDVAGSYTFNVTASGTDVSSDFKNASLVVNTAGYVQISDKNCSATSIVKSSGTMTMSFIAQNTGGSSATVSINLTNTGLTLSSGSTSTSFTLDSGSQSTRTYSFTAGPSAGAKTITSAITSTANDPEDQTCSVTITGTDINTATDAGTSGQANNSVYVKQSEKIITIILDSAAFNALLEEAGYTTQAKTDGFNIAKEFTIQRKIINYKGAGDNNYKTEVTLTITNPTSTDHNLFLVESIPKTFTSNSSNITFDKSFIIVKSDPIVSLGILLLKNATYTLTYSAKTDYNVEKTELFNLAFAKETPPITELIATDLCLNKNCDDSNPCTIDSCSNGTCLNTNASDGTYCTSGKCVTGECVIERQAPPIVRGENSSKLTIVGIVLTVIIIITVILFLAVKPKKNVKLGKNKLFK
ncbi:MAG: hypothetical protein NTY48_03670 [Candidatus Diapherotrites archaeon]|nr:hypothetical protein [Candidatus Diapherotrites archaeon]